MTFELKRTRLREKTTVFLIPLVLLFLVGTGASSLYAGSAGQATAEVLRLGAGAEHPAMGGAGVASVSGAPALQYNPAGLAADYRMDVDFTYQRMVEDINYGNFNFMSELGADEFIGLGLGYLDYGSVDRVEFSGDILQTSGSFTGMDLVGQAGYGRRWGNISAGINAKIIRLEIDDNAKTARAVDFGLLWRSGREEYPLSLGLALANLGSKVQGEDDGHEDELPATFRLGLSYDIPQVLGNNFRVDLDMENQLESGEIGFLGGIQWNPIERLALRTGYDDNLDVDGGLTAGAGFEFAEGMKFDYAYVPYGDFGNLHRFSFGFSLGANDNE